MSLPMDIIATNYLYGRFLFDLFALLPFGLLEKVNTRLKILWLLKIVRVRDIVKYTKKSQYLADINTIITWKQVHALNDPEKSTQMTQDYNYIDTKLFITALLKIFSILM